MPNHVYDDLGKEQTRDVDSTVEIAARVAAQIKHEELERTNNKKWD